MARYILFPRRTSPRFGAMSVAVVSQDEDGGSTTVNDTSRRTPPSGSQALPALPREPGNERVRGGDQREVSKKFVESCTLSSAL